MEGGNNSVGDKIEMWQLILHNWVSLCFSIILIIISGYMGKFKSDLSKSKTIDSAIMSGVQALLRSKIISEHERLLEKGFADVHEKENIKNVFDQYNNLGANGIMDCLVKEVIELPVHEIGGEN